MKITNITAVLLATLSIVTLTACNADFDEPDLTDKNGNVVLSTVQTEPESNVDWQGTYTDGTKYLFISDGNTKIYAVYPDESIFIYSSDDKITNTSFSYYSSSSLNGKSTGNRYKMSHDGKDTIHFVHTRESDETVTLTDSDFVRTETVPDDILKKYEEMTGKTE